jgi:hypothetical protein
MGTDRIRQAAFLLASAGFSEQDLHELMRAIRDGNGRKLLTAFYTAQSALRNEQATSTAAAGEPFSTDGVSGLVRRLLLKEAEMPVDEALSTLWEELREPRPPPARTSFSRAIEGLLQRHEDSAVLSAAHRVRNARIHRSMSPTWPLGGSKDRK